MGPKSKMDSVEVWMSEGLPPTVRHLETLVLVKNRG